MKKHLLSLAVFSLWGMVGSLYAQVNKTVWVNESFTISSEVDAAPGTYQWTRNGSVIPSSNTKDLTTSESTEGTYGYVRQIQTIGCPDWVSSNTYVVAVKSPFLPPNTGAQTWTFSGLTWTMSGQTWEDPDWQQTWSGASSYVPVNCELSNNFVNGAPARYSTSNLQAGSGYLYNYVCVFKERHNLCPAPWRVPTLQDFIDLDRYFGGTGENRTGQSLAGYITPNYVTAWGGVFGGVGSGTSVFDKGTFINIWGIFSNASLVYYLRVGTNGDVGPRYAASAYYGFQVRCVR
jgi:uncharacterized protein (TIGR02145 family)